MVIKNMTSTIVMLFLSKQYHLVYIHAKVPFCRQHDVASVVMMV